MITEVELPGIVEPEGLRMRTRSSPRIGPGQALVRMEATGISFAEQQMRRGKYYGQPSFPFVPGYDLVGVITELGSQESGLAVGQRVAALTKTGAWADQVVLDLGDLVAVPDGVGAEEAETVLVNGLTARRMLAEAKVRHGDTIVVLGANGGVGSLLVQMARCIGAEVIGVASQRHLPFVRELGAIPVDRAGDVNAEVRRIAQGGVAAVFDHVGGPGIRRSWSMLGRGGALVAYGTASSRDKPGNGQLALAILFARLWVWRILPNGRTATFFDLWTGRAQHTQRFQAALRTDLTAVFGELAAGRITPRIARTFPFSQIVEAMRCAESGTVAGKVIVVADHS